MGQGGVSNSTKFLNWVNPTSAGAIYSPLKWQDRYPTTLKWLAGFPIDFRHQPVWKVKFGMWIYRFFCFFTIFWPCVCCSQRKMLHFATRLGSSDLCFAHCRELGSVVNKKIPAWAVMTRTPKIQLMVGCSCRLVDKAGGFRWECLIVVAGKGCRFWWW